MDDERWGEVPRAFVALKPGSEGVDADVLTQWVRARLAGFKVPNRFDFLAELPKGGSGKILKADLRRRAT
jgi:acyl-CoA synthetase (AMP-forming)/AMP-acid ligase II